MKILIVEPHGDDAFISCSSALMRADLEITVMTFSDRHSHRLHDYYPSVHRTLWLDIPDVHYDLRLKYSTHEIHKKYIAGENLYEMYMSDMMYRILPQGRITDATHLQSVESYARFIKEFHDKAPTDLNVDLVILPVGLFHPNHYCTRRAANFILRDTPRIYYVDKPYIEKRYVQEILKCSTYDFYTAPVQDSETRAHIFKKLYPTEQGLLRFSRQTILEWKDIYAVGVEQENNPVVLKFLNKVSDMKEGDKYENLVCHVPQDKS